MGLVDPGPGSCPLRAREPTPPVFPGGAGGRPVVPGCGPGLMTAGGGGGVDGRPISARARLAKGAAARARTQNVVCNERCRIRSSSGGKPTAAFIAQFLIAGNITRWVRRCAVSSRPCAATLKPHARQVFVRVPRCSLVAAASAAPGCRRRSGRRGPSAAPWNGRAASPDASRCPGDSSFHTTGRCRPRAEGILSAPAPWRRRRAPSGCAAGPRSR